MQRASPTKWVYCVTIIGFCLRNAFDITIRQTINPAPSQRSHYSVSAARVTLRYTDGIVYYLSYQSSICWNISSLHWNEGSNLLRCKVERVLEAVSGFTNPFSSSFEDHELCFLSFGVPAKPYTALDIIKADNIGRKVVADIIGKLLDENLSFTTP